MVLRIAVYGGVTCSRPIPAPWDSLLSESQLMRNFLETEEYFCYIATHGYVLQKGEIVVQGNKAQLYENDIIKKAYLRG